MSKSEELNLIRSALRRRKNPGIIRRVPRSADLQGAVYLMRRSIAFFLTILFTLLGAASPNTPPVLATTTASGGLQVEPEATRVFLPFVKYSEDPPPSTRIAFISDRNYEMPYKFDLYTMRSDGTQITRVISHTPTQIWSPTWSPDGNRIAFQSGFGQIYVVNADGSAAQPVTPATISSFAPAWSPDGQWIMFSSDAFTPGKGLNIYKIRLDGSQLTRLTVNPPYTTPRDLNASWSPDGKRIIFERELTGSSKLYMMNADGSDLQSLPTQEWCATEPDWSPDGQWIAFGGVRCAYPDKNLFIVRTDGSDLKQITFKNEGSSPSWSPDGQWILISDTYDVNLVKLSTGQVRDLTPETYWHNAYPSWASN